MKQRLSQVRLYRFDSRLQTLDGPFSAVRKSYGVVRRMEIASAIPPSL